MHHTGTGQNLGNIIDASYRDLTGLINGN